METGKAYGFFNCRYSKKEIESELPTARRLSITPSELELSLIEDFESLDYRLFDIIREAHQNKIKYTLIATLPNATNKNTAEELSTIISNIYTSQLYEEGEDFPRALVYEDHGRYVSLEE